MGGEDIPLVISNDPGLIGINSALDESFTPPFTRVLAAPIKIISSFDGDEEECNREGDSSRLVQVSFGGMPGEKSLDEMLLED